MSQWLCVPLFGDGPLGEAREALRDSLAEFTSDDPETLQQFEARMGWPTEPEAEA